MPNRERQRTTAGEPMANVVIVGGAEEAQLILRGLLRLHQHRILGTGLPANAALEVLRTTADPVLLIDVDSKEPVWTDFVAEARRTNPATRVVLLSPTRSPRLEGQARAIGVAALVRRPFAIQELLSAVGPPTTGSPSTSSNPTPGPSSPAEEPGNR
jgi:response regulator RpfG family c-di-GMP phosphodiesterase